MSQVCCLLIILYDIRNTTSAVIATSNAVEVDNVNAPEVGAFETEVDGTVAMLVEVGGFENGMGEVKWVAIDICCRDSCKLIEAAPVPAGQ